MTIGEVSEKYALSITTLRRYERIGLLPKARRTENGARDYDERDCAWIAFVKRMRGAGFSMEALIDYAVLAQQGGGTAPARRQILVEQRELLAARIVETRKALESLNVRIQRYERALASAERERRF